MVIKLLCRDKVTIKTMTVRQQKYNNGHNLNKIHVALQRKNEYARRHESDKGLQSKHVDISQSVLKKKRAHHSLFIIFYCRVSFHEYTDSCFPLAMRKVCNFHQNVSVLWPH